MMQVLVTGSSGLIGSEAVTYFDHKGYDIVGVDNNMRREFFGAPGDTLWNLGRLQRVTRHFTHEPIDIRDREAIMALFQRNHFDFIVHCAAQPSHDKAKEIPFVDFEVNAVGTLNILEALRQHAPRAAMVFMSTNKVYGDAPNEYPLVEQETRWEYARPEDYNGINESCRVDQCLHSVFGASKAAADIMAQEYGRYFGLNVGIFRGGCLTGPAHSGVELHGFMSYLARCVVKGIPYRIYGYKGKQVRDQIHSSDVVRAMEAFAEHPRPGEVYNLGGGRANSASLMESIAMVEQAAGRRLEHSYVEQNRIGDHICYISDLTKLKTHYPNWAIQRDLPSIVEEIVTTLQAA